MIKIKKKGGQKKTPALPAFVIGYTHADAPPPGYLTAWFDQMYGGPLQIHFSNKSGHSQFEAVHATWGVAVNTTLSADAAERWKDRLQWSHSQVAEVMTLPIVGNEKREAALHSARIARGITILTEGTAYDVVTNSFLNPSDWNDLPLNQFALEDHVRVEQTENIDAGQTWFYTLGLAKFGLEEIEAFRPLGLPDHPVIDRLLSIGSEILAIGKAPNVGDQLILPESGHLVKIVRHRTDHSTGRLLQLREVRWE